MADEQINLVKNNTQTKLPSGRWLSTVLIVSTYCLILILGTICCIILACNGKHDIAEKLFVYIIGNLTGTAVGAIVAYHFKKKEEPNENV